MVNGDDVKNIQNICAGDTFLFYNEYYVNQFSPASAISIITVAKSFIWETVGSGAAVNIGTYETACWDSFLGAALGTQSNPNVLWVANCNSVWFRNISQASLTKTSYPSASYGRSIGVSVDPSSSTGMTAYVLTYLSWSRYCVIKTTDAGLTYTEITGNLNTAYTLNPG